jgi:hypothetical protein
MNRLIIILILTFSFQSISKADDITEFEIEGISIGDSVLDFFSKKDIKENTWDYFKNKEFTPLQFDYPKFAQTYDAIDISYKTSDQNFTIEALSGIIFYTDKKEINKCYKKMDSIVSDIRSLFSNLNESPKKTLKHRGTNDNGKSTFTSVYFEFLNQDSISVQCYNYSEETGDQNHLRIAISTKEYRVFLSTKAYNQP